MNNYQQDFGIEQMAKVLGVSRSGYYDFIKRSVSQRDHENKKLIDQIHVIFKASHETYGSPRIHAELKEKGVICSRQRVARLMKTHHLQAKMHKKFRRTTKRSQNDRMPRSDLVEQHFKVDHPNMVWVADLTYIPVNRKWVYLAVILDLFSRKIVVWPYKIT